MDDQVPHHCDSAQCIESMLRVARAHANTYVMARAQDEERELRAELGVGEDDQSLLDSMLSDETQEHASG